MDRDTDYFRRRAREEALRALKADKPEVAAAHHSLSIQYAAKARVAYQREIILAE